MITTDDINKIRQQVAAKQLKPGKITTDTIESIRQQMAQAAQPVQTTVNQPVEQPAQQPVQPTYANHGTISQQAHAQQQQKQNDISATVTKPMTSYLQSGGKIDKNDTASLAQLAREQGIQDTNYLQGRQQALNQPTLQDQYKVLPGSTTPVKIPQNTTKTTDAYDKAYGKQEAKTVTDNLTVTKDNQNADVYLKARADLEEAKRNNDKRGIARNEEIIKDYQDKYKEQYDGTEKKYSITSMRKHLNQQGEDVLKAEQKWLNATTEEEKQRYALEYQDAVDIYNRTLKNYQEAVVYDETINNNILKDTAKSGGLGFLGGVAKIEGGTYLAGSKLSGMDATTINTDSLLDYNSGKNFSINDLTNAVNMLNPLTGMMTRATGISEGPQSAYLHLKTLATLNPNNRRLAQLYNDITNHAYKGTKEDLANELDQIQKELYQDFKDRYTQATLNKEREQLEHNENVYGKYAFVPNSVNTVANMLPSQMLAPIGGEALSLGAMGLGAGQQAMDEALESGARYNQAFNYGVLSGVTEIATEKMFESGLNKALGIKGTVDPQELASKLISKLGIKNKLAKGTIQTIGSVAGESLEEMTSEAVNPLWRFLTYDKDGLPKNGYEYAKSIFNAGLEAIPSTLIMEGMGGGIKTLKINQMERGIIRSIQNDSSLSEIQKRQLIEDTQKAAREMILEDENTTLQEKILEKGIERNATKAEKALQRNDYDLSRAVQDIDRSSIKTKLEQAGATLEKDATDILQTIQDTRDVDIGIDPTLEGNGVHITNTDGTRQIVLNPKSPRAVEFVLTHELLHDMEGTQEYKDLQNLVLEDAKDKGTYEESRKAIEKAYKDQNVKFNLDDEVTNDIVANSIGDQNFYNNLLAKNPSVFNRMRNWFDNTFKGDLTKEERKLKNTFEGYFEKAYNQPFQKIYNGTQQSGTEYFSLIGYDERGYPKYRSNYGEDVTLSEKLDGLLEVLKTFKNKPIRFLVNGKKIMASFDDIGVKKTRYGTSTGERLETKKGMYAKTDLADDLYSIINQSKYIGDNDEISNISDTPPKNAAHEGVRKWYTFKNTINYNGELYDVLTTVREKDEGNYGYSVKFFERNKKNNLSQAYDSKSLRHNTQSSYSNSSIAPNQHNVNIQHSLSEAENTNDRTLAATHNLTREKLKGILELGGFPVPSIAISDVNKLTPTQFGDITVLFDKDTIDPADRRNEVYDRDVWSPTFPAVDYDINNADIKKYITKGLDINSRDGIISDVVTSYFYQENLSDKLARRGKEKLLQDIKEAPEMQYFYKTTVEKGDYAPVTKDLNYSNYHPNSTLERFIEIYNQNHDMSLSDFFEHYINYGDMQMTEEQREEINREIKEALRPELEAHYDNYLTEYEKKQHHIEDVIQKQLNNEIEIYGRYYDFLQKASLLDKNGAAKTIDEEATLRDISDHIDKQKYDEWVDNTFGKMFDDAKRGIRNDKDYLTPSGNRRSFKQLHLDYTLDNIVKTMTKEKTKGGENDIFGGGYGKTQAQLAKRFSTIEDIRNNKGNLMTTEDAANLTEKIKEKTSSDFDELAEYIQTKNNRQYDFRAYDEIMDAVQEFAGKYTNRLTLDNFKKVLNSYNINVDSKMSTILNNIIDDLEQLKEIPTDYFEAKPQRAVGLDEVASVLIPNDLPAEQKQALTDRGIKYTEYDPNVKGDRETKYRQAAQEILFSKSNNTWQDFLDENYNLARGKKSYFESLPNNEELQEQETKQIAESSEALREVAKPLDLQRDFKAVGNRKVNAYQYDNPEVKPFFQQEARNMLYDLDNVIKGERAATWDEYGKVHYTGVTRETTKDIAGLLDGTDGVKLSYDDIRKGLNAIIEDNGAENIAAAKRIEFVLDRRLREGYTDSYGTEYEPNDNYLNFLAGKDFIDPVEYDKQIQDRLIEEEESNRKFSLSEEQQKEVSDYVDKIYEDKTLDEDFRDRIVRRLNAVEDYSKFEGIKQDVEDYKDKMYKGISSLVDIANLREEDVKMRPMEYKQRKDKNTTNQRKFFDNAETSNIIAEQTKNRVNATTYEQKANLDTMEQVRQKLDERGNDMIEEWKSKQKNFTDKDVALGAILIERYQQEGDWNSAARAVEKLADMGTEAGRAVQMYSIFQRLSPETMEIYMQKNLDKAFEEMKQRKTGKWVEKNQEKYKLTGDDIQFIYEQVEKASQAIDEETKQRELSKIENRINEKLPPEDGQTIRALRRIAMLFNPKTQIRNVVGNTVIVPVNDVADFIGTKIDKLVAKKTGVRTTNNPNLITKAKGFKKGIKDAITDYKTGTRTTSTGSKYEFDIGAKAFNENTNNKTLNAINRKLNGINDLLSAVMSGGDRPFYEAAYKNSLEGQMKANNVTEPTQDMIDIAVNEALQRTWNDDNEYTRTVLGIRRAMNRINIHGFGLGDLIIPFAKTPANLTKAMVEYSPVGFLEAAYDFNDMRKAISRGEMTPMQQKRFVTSTSKAITGSMLYMIAAMLVKSGIVTGSADDDKDVKNFEQNVLGIQPYSVRVGDKTYTYSWANPINAPLAIMADTYKMSKENASKWDVLKNAFKVAGETLVDNSFLQGIKELFSKDSISEGLVEAIESFPESLIPTFMSQIASLGDKTQRQTFEYQNDFKTITNKIKNKLPGARNTLAPQVNTFGEEIENQNTIFNAFLNPANVREARITEEQKALYDVYEATKDKTIFPMQAPYHTNNDKGEQQNLSSQDRANYQKASGQYVNDIYKDLFSSDAFNDRRNEGKVTILQEIAKDGNLKGREAVGAVSTSTNSNLSKLNDNIESLEEAGIPLADYYLAWYAKNNLAQGSTYAAKQKAIRDYTDLTSKQEEVLFDIFNIEYKKGSK